VEPIHYDREGGRRSDPERKREEGKRGSSRAKEVERGK